MSAATSSSNIFRVIAAAAFAACLASAGHAGALPDTENGRYALSPLADGVLRLDTRTGAISTCNNSGAGWACYAVPDERAALDAEIGRLQADNEKLKALLAAREPTVSGKIEEPLPKSDSLKKPDPKVADGGRKIEIPLPSDRDMDRVMSFIERAWRQLIEMANRVTKAGTHNRSFSISTSIDVYFFCTKNSWWLWVPAFAGTTWRNHCDRIKIHLPCRPFYSHRDLHRILAVHRADARHGLHRSQRRAREIRA